MDSRLNSIPAVYISMTPKGKIREVNKMLEELLSTTNSELADKSIETIISMSSRIFFNTHLLPSILLRGSAEETFFFLRAADGTSIPVIGNFSLRTDDQIIEIVMLPVRHRKKYEDDLKKAKEEAEHALTEQTALVSLTKLLEAQTEKFDRQLTLRDIELTNRSQLNYILSHDFQEPVRKILIFADILSRQLMPDNNPDALSTVKKINRSATRMRNIVSLVEEFVRLDTEVISYRIDLVDIINQAKIKASNNRNFHDFDLTIIDIPSIDGFAEQLEILFYNLIDNAIQFRKKETRLSISVTGVAVKENLYKSMPDKYNYQDHIQISFTDNGIGFDEAYSSYIFQMFKTLDPTSQGIGFGLAICQRVVQRHFGSIDVSSQPNVGTTFTLVLPVTYLN